MRANDYKPIKAGQGWARLFNAINATLEIEMKLQ